MKRYPRFAIRVSPLMFLLLLFISPVALFAQKGGQMPITASAEARALFLQGRNKVDNLEDPGMLFEQAIQKDPNFALAYLYAGRTNQEFWKNLEKAVSLTDKVSAGEKEWILAAKAQAEGNSTERKQHLEQLLKLHPGDVRAHEQMAIYYRSIGDDASSLKHFAEAVKLDKNYAPGYNSIGYAYISLGRYPDAEQSFKTYIQLIPKNPNPYDSYAELLLKMGRYDESIEQYNKALALDPTFFNSYGGVGNNYIFKGDYVKARAAYQSMFDKAPDDGGRDQALVALMGSYFHEGKVDEALKVNERRREMAEKSKDVQRLIGIYSNAGFLLAESGRLDEAAKQFEMADQLREDASLSPAFKENARLGKMQNRARLLIARQEFGPAKTELEEIGRFVAAKKNPNQERAYNQTLGLLELGQKNYAKAVEYFSKAAPDDPYVWYYTAQAYEGLGDKQNATKLYRRIADWNQNDTGYAVVRPRAIAKLAEASSLASGQTTGTKPDESNAMGEKVGATSSAEQELIKLDKEWGEAGLRGDAAVLEGILADDFMGVSPTGIATKAQSIAEAKTNAANITNATYIADQYTVRFLDPNTAVMTHSALEKGLDKGKEYTDQHRSMHVWVKRNGRWQVVASQATPVPTKSTP